MDRLTSDSGVRSAICARREAHSHPNFVGWNPKISLGMQVGVRSGGCKEQNGKEREDDIKTHVNKWVMYPIETFGVG